jgi:hypothetical protein
MIPSIQRLGIAILVASSLEIAISFFSPLPSRAAFLTLDNGARCEGRFQGSNGRGLCIYSKVEGGSPYDYYEGEIRNGKPHGRGIFVYANDDRYEGQVSNGQPSGRGIFLFANNTRYEGTIINGEPNGTGTFTFENGNRYQGRVLNGQPHGKGTFTFANGQRYTGGFYLGQVKGKGILIHKNGLRCEGAFYNSKFTGKGTCTYPPGSPYRSYRGELRDGKPEGRGVLTYANGQVYTGELRDGKPFRPNSENSQNSQ